MGALCATALFQSPLVTIQDVRCRPLLGSCGAEERASSHQVVLVRSGTFVMHAGRQQVLAEPLHALFFNRSEPFQVSHPLPGGDDCTVLAFSSPVLADALGAHDAGMRDRPDSPFVHRTVLADPPTLLACQTLRGRVRQGSGTLAVEESALAILAALLRRAYRSGAPEHAPHARVSAELRTRIEAARLLIAADPGAGPDLATLARAVSCSPYHLARGFAQVVGLSIHQYRVRLRLTLALERLSEGVRNLSRVALDLGFSSHGHFSTTFQRVFQLPPSAFRRGVSTRSLRSILPR